jgi:predicted NUDIX family NTP pyrophosphohydrolase
MSAISAGLALVRLRAGTLEVLLVHPGGPFWAKKDAGVWTLPKGLVAPGEALLAAAQREFGEETGFTATGPFLALGSIRQKSGKEVYAWAFVGDCKPEELRSNAVEIDWPPRSGKKLVIPEADRGAFFTLREAREKILPAQFPLLEKLAEYFPGEFLRSLHD